MRTRRICGDDVGAALVAALALSVLAGFGVAVVAHIGRAAVVQQQTRTAADLAALAAAGSWLGLSEEPCTAAARVAAGNRARLLSCAVVGASGEVILEVQGHRRLWPTGTVTARARAGVRPIGDPAASARPPR